MIVCLLTIIRLSYISVDSGRSSDTYAETSASSIASSSSSSNNNNNSHSNRLNSNASNCSSADSGTDLSRSTVGGHGVKTAPVMMIQNCAGGDCSATAETKNPPMEEDQLMRGGVTSSSAASSADLGEEKEGVRGMYCCTAVPREERTAAGPPHLPQPEVIYARIQVG